MMRARPGGGATIRFYRGRGGILQNLSYFATRKRTIKPQSLFLGPPLGGVYSAGRGREKCRCFLSKTFPSPPHGRPAAGDFATGLDVLWTFWVHTQGDLFCRAWAREVPVHKQSVQAGGEIPQISHFHNFYPGWGHEEAYHKAPKPFFGSTPGGGLLGRTWA